MKKNSSLADVVKKQIAENNPPEAKLTLQRLVQAGLSEEMAIGMLTDALTCEMYFMLKEERPYYPENYVQWLNHLPEYAC